MDSLDTDSLTDDEGRLLAEGIAAACSHALGGMLVEVTCIPEHAAFFVQLAVATRPEVYH